MITYGSNLSIVKALPELQKPQRKRKRSWLFYLIDFVADLIVDIIGTAAKILTGGNKIIGNAVEIGLGALKDILLPLAFGYEVDWKEVGTNAIFRLLVNGISGALKHTKKFLRRVKNLTFIKKVVNTTKKIINFVKNPKGLLNFAVNKLTYSLKRKLITKFGKIKSTKIIKFVRNSIKTFIFSIYTGISFAKAKDKKKFILNRGKNLLSGFAKRKINSFKNKLIIPKIREIAKNKKTTTKDFVSFLQKNDKTWIKFNDSHWIDGIKIASNDWIENENDNFVSFYIFFNKITTRNKKALIFIDTPIEQFKKFILASSKGKFYLDNFAWGWEIGKHIRNKTKFFINKLSTNSKYNNHFVASISTFNINSNNAIEELRNEFKVLSSTRNRKLGNQIAIEFNDNKIDFFKQGSIRTEKKFDLFINKNKSKIRKTTKTFSLVKSIKKL